MALGTFPNVPPEDRVYVDVDSDGGFVYVRYEGGREIQVTDAELEAIGGQWVFFYSTAALAQVRSTEPKETSS